MRLLLDTHVVLWALQGSERLGRSARAALVDARNDVYVSAISAVEVAIKSGAGKLRGAEDFVGLCGRTGFDELPLTAAHADGLRALPAHHHDPFDRLLVSQARHEGLTLVTADPLCRTYPVTTMDPKA